MLSLCFVFPLFPYPAGFFMPPGCSDVPGYAPLSREPSQSMTAVLPLWQKIGVNKSSYLPVLLYSASLYHPVSRFAFFFIYHALTNKHTQCTPVFAKGVSKREQQPLLPCLL